MAGATGHRIVTELDVNEDESVYYDGGYWNNFDPTLQMFRQRVADGSPGRWFSDYFAHRSKPFAARCSSIAGTGGWKERWSATVSSVRASASTTPKGCCRRHAGRRQRSTCR